MHHGKNKRLVDPVVPWCLRVAVRLRNLRPFVLWWNWSSELRMVLRYPWIAYLCCTCNRCPYPGTAACKSSRTTDVLYCIMKRVESFHKELTNGLHFQTYSTWIAVSETYSTHVWSRTLVIAHLWSRKYSHFFHVRLLKYPSLFVMNSDRLMMMEGGSGCIDWH